jgi:serine/threonine protein kinase
LLSEWIGKTLSKVVIQDRIDRGSMAEVYLGHHTTLNRAMVVKVLYAHLSEDPHVLKRFRNEAHAVAALSHPNIVRVFDFDSIDGRPYIVMELLEGLSLSAYINSLRLKSMHIPKTMIARLIYRLADALDYAHSEGVLHRDIKPANVMLRNGSQGITAGHPLPTDVEPVLTDFGLARISFSPDRTAPGMVMGTPAYMSPEQVEGGDIDERADIYSLGVMTYEMLAGYLPFGSAMDTAASMMYMQVYTPAPPIPDAGPDLQTVIERVMAKEATKRYDTAVEFSTALGQACSSEASTRPLSPKFKLPRWSIAAAVALPIITLAVILGLRSKPESAGAVQAQTEQPVVETASVEPELTREPGTFPTVIGEPTAFPTLEVDPRTALDMSSPDFEDPFDGANYWGTYDEDSSAAYSVGAGSLTGVDYFPEEKYTWWTMTAQQSGNVYVEISGTNGDCFAKDSLGLAMRVDQDNGRSGYGYEVSCDGHWRFRRHHHDAGPRVLVDWVPSPLIDQGYGATNRLGVLAYQGRFVFYVNGQQVGSFTENNYQYSFGSFALFVRASVTYDLTASFDNFSYWHLRTSPWG